MFTKSDKSDMEKPWGKAFFNKRSFRYGSMATAFTAIFIGIIVVINIVMTVLTDRFPLSIDLTSKKTYALSQKSIDFIKKVNQKIKITVLATEEEYLNGTDTAPCAKIMNQYPQYNSNISIEYIDITKNPAFAAQYSRENLNSNDIVVASSKRYKVISLSDLLEVNYSYDQSYNPRTTVTGDKTEQEMDSAIDFVTSDNLPVVAFTTGHGEADSTDLQNLLGKNNYVAKSLNLSTDTLDDSVHVMAIVAPSVDFTTSEIKKIDDFLNNGGKMDKSLAVFLDPTKSSLPNLEGYVKEWGLEAGSGIIYDKTNAFSTSVFCPIEGEINSDIAGQIESGIHADIFQSKPINLLFDTQGSITTYSVVKTKDTSQLWNPGKIDKNTTVTLSDSDPHGPFTAIAMATKKGSYNNKDVSSNVLLSGTYGFVSGSQLTAPNLANADIILNTVNHMGGYKSSITIVPKQRNTTTLTMTASQAQFVIILFAVIIPLAVLVLGFVVWFRRRHL